MYKCDVQRMDDKIKTFSKFGDAGHGGITRYSLSPEAHMARDEFVRRMKAIGATNNNILSIFLGEAAGIGFLGGVGGFLLGWAICGVINLLAGSYLASQSGGGTTLATSIPGVYADLDRPAEIRVQAWNERGRRFELRAEIPGLGGRAQHGRHARDRARLRGFLAGLVAVAKELEVGERRDRRAARRRRSGGARAGDPPRHRWRGRR